MVDSRALPSEQLQINAGFHHRSGHDLLEKRGRDRARAQKTRPQSLRARPKERLEVKRLAGP